MNENETKTKIKAKTEPKKEHWPEEVPMNSRAFQVLCFNKWVPRAQAVFWTGGSPQRFDELVGEKCCIRSRPLKKNSARRVYNLWDCMNHCAIHRANRYTSDWLKNN